MITRNLVFLKNVCELGGGGGGRKQKKTNEKPGRKASYQKTMVLGWTVTTTAPLDELLLLPMGWRGPRPSL
jgi:hypothetical protein